MAAAALDVTVRTLPRYFQRYRQSGADGLRDRRGGPRPRLTPTQVAAMVAAERGRSSKGLNEVCPQCRLLSSLDIRTRPKAFFGSLAWQPDSKLALTPPGRSPFWGRGTAYRGGIAVLRGPTVHPCGKHAFGPRSRLAGGSRWNFVSAGVLAPCRPRRLLRQPGGRWRVADSPDIFIGGRQRVSNWCGSLF